MGLLYAKHAVINDDVSVTIPLLRDIIAKNEDYYSALHMFIATPKDYMVQLYDMGIDFSTLTQYDLFLMLFGNVQNIITQRKILNSITTESQNEDVVIPEDVIIPNLGMILDGYSFEDLHLAINPQNQMCILVDDSGKTIIDKNIHYQICKKLRAIHYIPEDHTKPGNEEAKRFLIERARVKQARAIKKAKNTTLSQLEELIVALVNTEQFSYNYESVQNLSIFQFNTSVQQIIHKINYDNIMRGCYAGTLDTSKLSQSELNWLTIQ